MNKIRLRTKSKIRDGLLLTGVPFRKGAFFPTQGLSMTSRGNELPLWWDVRSSWDDGSVKWIFIHTRVPEGDHEAVLEIVDRNQQTSGANVDLEANVLSIGDTRLTISGRLWTFSTPSGAWSLIDDQTDTELEPVGETTVEWVEDSPIAPLIRIKPSGVRDGLMVDQLIRIDSLAQRIIWERRMTWNRPGQYHLKSARSRLTIRTRDSGGEGSVRIPSPGRMCLDGHAEQTGYPDGKVERPGHALWVEKAWQRAPFGTAWEGDRVDIFFYPPESEALGVTGGTSFRHTTHLCCGEQAGSLAGHTVDVSIDPDYLSGMAIFGHAIPRADELKKNFPGYEKAFHSTLESGRLTRLGDGNLTALPAAALEDEAAQDPDYFGLQHYGDWPMPWGSYGLKDRRMYSSNEYDTAYAYYQGYAIYGNMSYRELARHCAIHMTDVDWISYSGDMRFHGYTETAEDHQLHRTDTGDYGHYWTDGYWLLYFFSGDIWAKESALAVSRYLAELFIRGGEDMMRRIWAGAERHLGWPMVALMASYEATGDDGLLPCIRGIVQFIDRYTADPDAQLNRERGTADQPIVWWRTAMEDGCKPFMLGIILEGLERYHRISDDPAAARAIRRICGFLVEKMWHPARAAFTYEYNAYNRGHRSIISHELTTLFVSGLGYAYTITGEQRFRTVSEKAFHACLWTLYDPSSGGKSIAIMGRSIASYVEKANAWIQNDDQAYRESLTASSGRPFSWEGGIQELLVSGLIRQTEGEPSFADGALISSKDSYLAAEFVEGTCADSGMLEFAVNLQEGTTTWLNQRSYFHLSHQENTESCISVITFYNGIFVRVYDQNRELIEVADGIIQDIDAKGQPVDMPNPVWEEGQWHHVRVQWSAPGEVSLTLDGGRVDSRRLDRPIGNRFRNLFVGYKPGNWRANAAIKLITLRLGVPDH